MALEFPSWLEWLSWLVGSEWPHGNEDKMWQMARDLESVAGQSDELIDELTHLIDSIKGAYPDGVGGEEVLAWLKPLRDGDDSGHGSVREFGDNYRQLSKAADDMGTHLQAAKLNFYIAGAFLVAEMAWAIWTGPFAPETEAVVIAAGRQAFNRLGRMFLARIEGLLESRITNAVLRKIVAKTIYEIGQGAVVSTLQGVGQEMLVQTIQNMDGHGNGYDWNAIGKNAMISALSGAGGGAIGAGMNHVLPSDMGGWRGAFNGTVTGGISGLGGAGLSWLGNGVVNGNWDLDPRTLTGGAFAGAGPGGIHGYNGWSPHDGPRNLQAPDGTATVPHDGTTPRVDPTGTNGHPSVNGEPGNTGQPGGTTDPTTHSGNSGDPTAAHPGSTGDPTAAHPGTTGEPTTAAPGGDSATPISHDGRDGGATMHPTSSPEATTTEHPTPTDHTDSSHDAPADNHAPPGVDGRRERPDADPQNGSDTTDSTSGHRPDSHAPTTDTSANGDASRNGDSHTDSRPDATAAAPRDVNHPAAGAIPTADGSSAPAAQHNAGGENGRVAPTSPVGGTPNPGSTANAAPATTHTSATPGGDVRAAADPSRSTGLPRDLRAGPAADGTTPKPAGAPQDSRATVADKPFRADTDAVQASRTGVEPEGPRPVDATGDHHQTAEQHPAVDGHDRPDSDGHDRPGTDTHDPAPADHDGRLQAGLPGDAPPVPVPMPHDADGGGPRTPSDSRRYAAAAPVGDFHGEARPESSPDLEPDFVDRQIDAHQDLITPEGVTWNHDERHFVLPDGSTVRVEVAETHAQGGTGQRDVAQIHERPGGYDIHVSPRARDEDVVRAVAHELAEIRLAQDDPIPLDRPDMREDRPGEMTPHLAGRFAELRVLDAHITEATADRARADQVSRLRQDQHDLAERLGLHDPDHAPTVERLLSVHDPALGRRLGIEPTGSPDPHSGAAPDNSHAPPDRQVWPPGPHEIESTYGIPEENQAKIQHYADQHGLIIDVRPTNPDAVAHLQDGAMPKPMAIKDKTINAADIELGAPAEAKGLVGRFEPGQLRLPDADSVSPERLAELQKRLSDRENDHAAYRDHMDKLIDQGEFRVTPEGIVEGRVGDVFKPVTGDHDLFDIRHADGSRLTPAELRQHEGWLALLNAGIMHGPHVYWDPPSEYQRTRNFEKIINEHLYDADPDTSHEPLIRFAPRAEPTVVWSDRTIADIDREMAPWHLESDLGRLATYDPDHIAQVRDRAAGYFARPGFDHAAYRAELGGDGTNSVRSGSPEHLAAIVRLKARVHTDPAEILRILDSHERPDTGGHNGGPHPGPDSSQQPGNGHEPVAQSGHDAPDPNQAAAPANPRYADPGTDRVIDSGDPKFHERFVEWNRPTHQPADPQHPHAPRKPIDVHDEIPAPHRNRENVPDGNKAPADLQPIANPGPVPEPLRGLPGHEPLHPWTAYPVVNENGTRTTFFTDGDGVVKWVEATPGARAKAIDGFGKWSGFNPDLSHPLLPNAQYQVPNFHNGNKMLSFHTDAHGQTDALTGEVEPGGQDKNHRDDDKKKGAQQRAYQEGEAAFPKEPPGRTLTPEELEQARIKWAGGHLLANELGGIGEYLNMHPQMAASNSGNERDGWVHAASWRAKENQLVEFSKQDGQDVRNYQVKMTRDADGVPDAVVMRWQEVTYARNPDGSVKLGPDGKPEVESVVAKERVFPNKEANYGPQRRYSKR